MYIRIRAILVIVLVNLVIISFSVLAGIVNVRSDVAHTQKTDLVLISEIADHFIRGEIEMLKLTVAGMAQILSASDETKWAEVFANLDQHHDFIGMVVLDSDRKFVISAGEAPIPLDIVDEPFIKEAFSGQKMISSTIPLSDHEVVFYVAAPLQGTENRILVATLGGEYFSQLLSSFSIWDTGYIFLCDSEGYVIANPLREHWVHGRFNLIRAAETDTTLTLLSEAVGRMITGESGTATYSFEGDPRICAFRPVTGLSEGWGLGIVAPLSKSPFRIIGRGLIVVGLVSFCLSIVFAAIASSSIKKPFEEIAALKEAAETNSRLKSSFIANMSHEIRTPMNAILGITEILMQDEDLEESVSAGLDKIYSSGDMLLNIINDLLDLSKIEAGKMTLMIHRYELASLINDLAVLNLMRFESKPIELKLFMDETLPATLLGDELRIKQVLNNLLTNAFKYTEKGEVRVTFAVERSDGEPNNVTLVFSVSDTGQGMTVEQVSALFDEYTRFNSSANRTIEGTGLGMSITQNLLRLMNGEITVKSELHRGSEFIVRIPQKRVGSEVVGREMAESLQLLKLEGIRQLKKTRMLYEPMPYGSVLIVDDVESNLYVAKGLMMPYRLTVETATNGLQAIEKIKSGKVFDIIFMDHMMPKMSGMETTKIIRSLGYKHPIVALTANAVVGQMDIFLENGFDDFISKPVDVRYLNAVLKKFVRDKQPPEVIENTYRQLGKSKLFSAHEVAQPLLSPQLAEFFVRDATRAIAVLEEIIGRDIYEDEDLRMAMVSVHAMKNALLNIGESELSAFAGKLEQAALKKEIGVIAGATPPFLVKLRKITVKLATQNDENEESGIECVGNNAELREKLLVLKRACAMYNKRAAKDALSELRKKVWSSTIRELLRAINTHLMSGDYYEVSRVSDKIIDMIDKSDADI